MERLKLDTTMLISLITHLVVLSSHLLILTADHEVVYYVKPTEPCAHNSSCPSNETCHTMDHYASNSSHYFSSDHINVTLYFMCGVHNCTQNMDITDLERLTMVSSSGKNDVTFYMPMARNIPNDPKNIGNRTYKFANIITLRIENITIFFISLNFVGKNSTLEAVGVHFYGYLGSMSSQVSVINVTGSRAVLKDSIFQQNCFIRIQSNTALQVNNCKFSSYSHAVYSVIFIDNSTLRLTGTVTFINNKVGNDQYYSCGAAISINPGDTCEGVSRSIFSITKAYIYMKNNTASSCGGVFYMRCTLMTIFDNVSMIIINNAIMSKYNNYGSGGGAMYLIKSDFIVNNSDIQFINNSAKGIAHGGAIYGVIYGVWCYLFC